MQENKKEIVKFIYMHTNTHTHTRAALENYRFIDVCICFYIFEWVNSNKGKWRNHHVHRMRSRKGECHVQIGSIRTHMPCQHGWVLRAKCTKTTTTDEKSTENQLIVWLLFKASYWIVCVPWVANILANNTHFNRWPFIERNSSQHFSSLSLSSSSSSPSLSFCCVLLFFFIISAHIILSIKQS